ADRSPSLVAVEDALQPIGGILPFRYEIVGLVPRKHCGPVFLDQGQKGGRLGSIKSAELVRACLDGTPHTIEFGADACADLAGPRHLVGRAAKYNLVVAGAFDIMIGRRPNAA